MCLAVPEPPVLLKLLMFGPLGPGTNTGLGSNANRLSVCLALGDHITELGVQFESFVHRGLSGRGILQTAIGSGATSVFGCN